MILHTMLAQLSATAKLPDSKSHSAGKHEFRVLLVQAALALTPENVATDAAVSSSSEGEEEAGRQRHCALSGHWGKCRLKFLHLAFAIASAMYRVFSANVP